MQFFKFEAMFLAQELRWRLQFYPSTISFIIAVTTPTKSYTLGTDDKIDLRVKLNNHGKDSYLTTLNVDLPDGVNYANIVLDEDQCLPIACQQVS